MDALDLLNQLCIKILYCADCGAKLTHHSNLVQGKYIDDAFSWAIVCSLLFNFSDLQKS